MIEIPYITLSDNVTIQIENFNNDTIVIALLKNAYNFIIAHQTDLVEIINLFSFISFWTIGLFLFLQAWELLVSYTASYNKKHAQIAINAKTSLVISEKLNSNTSKKYTNYFL